MKKILELLKLQPSKGDLGVEIECEGLKLNPIESNNWKTEQDNSLRGDYPTQSSEYVIRKPVSNSVFKKALDELIAHQEKATLNFSFRTSVHVHVNVQELTEDELLAFIYACILLEEPLMNYCGEGRKGNRFCLRIQDAEGYMEVLNDVFERGHSYIRGLRGEYIRYSAINLHSLVKYGSVEFRGMRGNMDKNILIPWTTALLNIRKVAKKLGTPVNVYNAFVSSSNEQFAKTLLGTSFDKFNYQGLSDDMSQSFSLSIALPHLWIKGSEDRKKVLQKEAAAEEWPQVAQRIPAAVRFVGPPEPVQIQRDKDFDHLLIAKMMEDLKLEFGEDIWNGAILPGGGGGALAVMINRIKHYV